MENDVEKLGIGYWDWDWVNPQSQSPSEKTLLKKLGIGPSPQSQIFITQALLLNHFF